MKQWTVTAGSRDGKEKNISSWVIAAPNGEIAAEAGFRLAEEEHLKTSDISIFTTEYPLDTEGRENKKEITTRLYRTLIMTREFMELESLVYVKQTEKVIARFKNGRIKTINVECDSGIALVVDVITGLLK